MAFPEYTIIENHYRIETEENIGRFRRRRLNRLAKIRGRVGEIQFLTLFDHLL